MRSELTATGLRSLGLAIAAFSTMATAAGWQEIGVGTLVDGQGRLLARNGQVMADRGGNPLVPACALDLVPNLAQPFRFFVQPGASSKLLIFHDGGGACWEGNTCASPLVPGDATYDPLITETTANLPQLRGVLDDTAASNPFRDWTKIFIPYCTGDVGWGNQDTVYQTPIGSLPVRHRGFANVKAVLRWVENHYADNHLPMPAQVAVTGSSAGAYATIGAVFPEISGMLPASTRTSVIADSGNGIVTNSWVATARDSWGYSRTLPDYLLPAFAQGAEGLPVRIFGQLTARFRNTRFGQYQNAYDGVQSLVFNIMKHTSEPAKWDDLQYLAPSLVEWSASARLATNLAAIAPNYRYYTAAGTEHVVLVNIPAEADAGFCSDDFYTENSAGNLRFRDWTNAMVNGGGFLWSTGNWRNATCFPNCVVAPKPGCLTLVQP